MLAACIYALLERIVPEKDIKGSRTLGGHVPHPTLSWVVLVVMVVFVMITVQYLIGGSYNKSLGCRCRQHELTVP